MRFLLVISLLFFALGSCSNDNYTFEEVYFQEDEKRAFKKINNSPIKDSVIEKDLIRDSTDIKSGLVNDYFEKFQEQFISVECVDLNEIIVKNKAQYIYGFQYFCDSDNFEKGGTNVMFANGLIKIDGNLHFLKPVLYFKNRIYFLDGEYLIVSTSNTSIAGKAKLTIYNLRNGIKYSYLLYAKWYCEA
jgi:hypothetical protein